MAKDRVIDQQHHHIPVKKWELNRRSRCLRREVSVRPIAGKVRVKNRKNEQDHEGAVASSR
jgi:hypothetical protein